MLRRAMFSVVVLTSLVVLAVVTGRATADGPLSPAPMAEKRHALLGKPAPALKLPLADGGTVDLADHKGKDVVILDFWATWCGPCVQGLPIVTKAAEDFADKGVVFYAVNVQENASDVTPFLKKHRLDIKVPLDADGTVSQQYGVTGIPQTVIIDKDGVVRVVHVGLSGDLDTRLPRELQAVVDGKKP